jgi:cell division protein FtsA
LPELIDAEDTVEVVAFGEGTPQTVSRLEMARILEARAEEMLAMVLNEIKRSGYEGLLPAGLVLTGGTAAMGGYRELAREMLQLPVRIGNVRNISGLTDTVSGPAYATAVGLLQWGLHQGSMYKGPRRTERGGDLFQRFRDILRPFLPH